MGFCGITTKKLQKNCYSNELITEKEKNPHPKTQIITLKNNEYSKEVLIVLDAETGQNAISQVKAFKETTDITGLVLTKFDGTAKGGVVLGIVSPAAIF